MKKESSLVGSAILANLTQIIFCFIIFFISRFVSYSNLAFQIGMLLIEIALWIILGFRYSMYDDIKEFSKTVKSVLLVLLPIIIITIIGYFIHFSGATQGKAWSQFFFFGSPLIFYNRPIILIGRLIKGNAYYLFIINYLLIFISYLMGGLVAFSIKNGNRRKKERMAQNRLNRDRRREMSEGRTSPIPREELENSDRIRRGSNQNISGEIKKEGRNPQNKKKQPEREHRASKSTSRKKNGAKRKWQHG